MLENTDIKIFDLFQHYNVIKLNGRVVRKVENRNPKTYNNVKVWAAKAAYGFPAADAYIKDLVYENLGKTLSVSVYIVQFVETQRFYSRWKACDPKHACGNIANLGSIIQSLPQHLHQLIWWNKPEGWKVGRTSPFYYNWK